MSGSERFDPDRYDWEAWRPEQAQRALAQVDVPWYIAAGWAIELFLGGQRREHEDLEIAVPSARFREVVAALAGLDLFVIGPALAVPLGQAGALLETYHQTWALDPAHRVWRLDIFREPSDGDIWICRRDESIRLPYDELIEWTSDGIPYGRPDVVLGQLSR